MNFTFKPAFSGACPSCTAFHRIWYIADRNISNSETYEYCLMSVSTEQKKSYHFKDLRKVTEWICVIEDLSGQSDWYIKNWFLRRFIKHETNDAILLEKEGSQYILNKHTFTVTPHHKHIQETGWFSSYNDCLRIAKEILEKIELKEQGEQIKLFL